MTIDRFSSDRPCDVLILTNPKAGSGRHRKQIPRLRNLIEQAKIDHHLCHSLDEFRLRLSESRPARRTVVVPAGGDGTISLAASVIDRDVAIVPMPLGTENLLAREFGHSADAEAVVRTIRHGAPYYLDAGTAGNRPFLIMATCGFDAEVVRAMHFIRRGHIRRLSYFGPVIRALRRYRFPEITARVDGESLQGCWTMVFNLPRYGGHLSIEPRAIGNDGMLDVVVFQRGSIVSGLKYVAGIWLGRHHRFRDVIRRRGRVIEVSSSQRVPYELDGDYAGRLPLRIGVTPGRVQLLLPPDRLPESA